MTESTVLNAINNVNARVVIANASWVVAGVQDEHPFRDVMSACDFPRDNMSRCHFPTTTYRSVAFTGFRPCPLPAVIRAINLIHLRPKPGINQLTLLMFSPSRDTSHTAKSAWMSIHVSRRNKKNHMAPFARSFNSNGFGVILHARHRLTPLVSLPGRLTRGAGNSCPPNYTVNQTFLRIFTRQIGGESYV